MDFHGIITLKRPIVDQLSRYLDEKESQTGIKILEAINPFQGESLTPLLAPIPELRYRLSDAVEGFGKKVRQVQQSQLVLTDPNDWKKSVTQVNAAFWEYLETLEEYITELFQQLEQVGIEEWHTDLADVVHEIKEMLTHHLEDLRWAILRMENQLKDYKKICEKKQGRWSELGRAAFFWKSLLDRKLLSNVDKSRKYLGFRYQSFADRFSRYQDIHAKIEQLTEKFNHYEIFKTLDPENQEKFKKLYRLVRLWEVNTHVKSLPQNEPIRSLRHMISPDKAFTLFKDYYQHLHKALFDRSRALKSDWINALEESGVKKIEEDVLQYRTELVTLGATITKYRDFLLSTDPNPYVRVRMGFPEWVAGPEPVQTKKLLNLSYDVETLDRKMELFRQGIENKKAASTSIDPIKYEVIDVLHEMGQPLMSRQLMRHKAEKAVSLLQQMDELSTTKQEAVDFTGSSLAKLMRSDWKYQTLFDLSAFHVVYETHHHIVETVNDRNHLNRLQKFKRFIQQIEQWVKNDDTPRHTHEIELDINDMKGYLQDFLAQVQRICKEEAEDSTRLHQSVTDMEKELLEYRYQFGNFFHHLHENKPEERLIRHQFLFVDQYFEAVENLLHDWKEEQQRRAK